jgi:hypothetical protein
MSDDDDFMMVSCPILFSHKLTVRTEQMRRYFHPLITTSKLNRQEYDFDYDDDDDADMDDAGGDIENQYYKAKCTFPISCCILISDIADDKH